MTHPPKLLAMLLLASCSEATPTDPSTTQHRGALTWSYAGQQPPSHGRGALASMSYVVQPGSRSDDDKLRAMTRMDADGSLWRVDDVDRDAVDAQLVSHGPPRDDTPAANAPLETAGEVHTITPYSWTVGSCGNAYYMGDDDRVQVSVNNSRRKAVVEIRAAAPGHSCPYGGDYVACLADNQTVDYCKTFVLNCHPTPPSSWSICTGTILRSQWVLTAAHCLFDENGATRQPAELKVKRWDTTAGELAVSAWFMDGAFNGSWNPGDDWALLKMSTPFTAPYYDMDISDASDTKLGNLGGAVTNVAFPQYAPNCSSNLDTSNTYFAAMWNNTAGELGAIYSEKIDLKFDSGPGESGSPFFFCPDGADDSCTGDELGEIIALTTGYDSFITSLVGPKAPAFRSTAITTMDNN